MALILPLAVLAGKPDPERATTVPGGPRTGATVMVGVPLCGVTAVGGAQHDSRILFLFHHV